MRKWFICVTVLWGLMSSQLAWAEMAWLGELDILPLDKDRVLIHLDREQPLVVEVTRHGGFPAVWLQQTAIPPSWVTPSKTLKRDAFIRPLPFHVAVQTVTDKGTWLVFQTLDPLTVSVVTNDAAFLSETSRSLPVYTQWPYVPPNQRLNPLFLLNQAISAFGQGNIDLAVQSMETIFSQTEQPPAVLYRLLSLLYLYREDWLNALVVMSEGACLYPETMGLQYSALLYQLKQPDKSAFVLSDLLEHGKLSTPADIAQAQFMLGTIYSEQKRYNEAVPFLRASSDVFLQEPTVWFNLAIAYEGSSNPQMALESYKRALPYAKGKFADEIQSQIERVKRKVDPPGANMGQHR